MKSGELVLIYYVQWCCSLVSGLLVNAEIFYTHILLLLLLLLLLLTAIGLCPVTVFTKTKYMKIHSTIQYIFMSTIQVHEHYKTQETENTEKNRKY
jgi:hypothetical protein